MLKYQQLVDLAKSRLEEAQLLHDAQKYDGAIYMCGYAIEMSLKAAILHERLDDGGFPSDNEEFDLVKDSKTHDLKVLLENLGSAKFSGDGDFHRAWGIVTQWKSEYRYRPIGEAKISDSGQLLSASHDIMNKLGIR